jgi:hypothetical protein
MTVPASKTETTTVDLVIRLQVAGSPADVAKHLGALQCLASIMATQAEDGLWSGGSPDGEVDEIPSEHVADIDHAYEQAVLIDGKTVWTAAWTATEERR